MTEALRVLIVEDSPTDAKLVVQSLRETGRAVHYERVEDAASMRRSLETGPWDLVLSDWSMPKFSAMGALAVLKESGLDLPFIIVSGTVGEELAADAMRAGAHDYVLKDRLGRLLPAVERELRECNDRAAHRDSEERKAALIDSGLDAIIGMDHRGRITEFNPAAEKLFGYSRAEALQQPVADLIVPERMRDAHRAGLEQYLRTGESRLVGKPVELNAARRDGTEFPVELTVTRVGSALPPSFMGFIRDLSERANAQAALAEVQSRLTRLAESGIIGIVIADVHGHVEDANEAYLRMVGYSREELVQGAVRWVDLTPPELRHLADDARKQLQASGVARPWETETLCKDGRRVPILVGVAALEYPNTIAFIADLTAQRQAERGRILAEENLRQKEEQLRQAQKMEAVGRLAGGVAHDFNNVLSVILSIGEFLLDELKESDPMRADVSEIVKAALRAAGLTRQLLLFSRQQVVEPRVLDLHEVLTTMERMLHRILGEDVDLVLLPPKASGRVKVDPSHVEQVILNLVVNARDAMPMGGKLTIETDNVVLDEGYVNGHLPAKGGPHVMLAVTDTGTGMDRETQARIFEPFFTTKEMGKGTGLGLSTVFGIVQQSGGSIWVYSEPGKGTTFKIYLPRVDAEKDVARTTAAPSVRRGTETVLLVEDEEQVRAVVLGALRRLGYTVISAENAGEALLLCETRPEKIDLLLTDVVMPQMSGPDLAKRLVSMRPGMKVLCMSGYTDDSIVRHGVLKSGVAFIQKPVTPALLGRKVREVLDRPQLVSLLPPPGEGGTP